MKQDGTKHTEELSAEQGVGSEGGFSRANEWQDVPTLLWVHGQSWVLIEVWRQNPDSD